MKKKELLRCGFMNGEDPGSFLWKSRLCPGFKAASLCMEEGGNGRVSASRLLGEGRIFNSGIFCFLHQVEDVAAGQESEVHGKGRKDQSTLRSDWALQPG